MLPDLSRLNPKLASAVLRLNSWSGLQHRDCFPFSPDRKRANPNATQSLTSIGAPAVARNLPYQLRPPVVVQYETLLRCDAFPTARILTVSRRLDTVHRSWNNLTSGKLPFVEVIFTALR